ncbi:MAG: S-methyl-5-thioribose-1-phosphate isomerase [Gammaproteobacteria bacterium]|nr:S-methyl-5-thioribose-1-phosphate isomerase [Gammaproteobacteria bacterium]
MVSVGGRLGLEGEFVEADLPLLVRRAGMAEWQDDRVRILDRRALPLVEQYLECRSAEEVAVAIEDMVIQGAFSLSIAAGYGLALAAMNGPGNLKSIRSAADRLLKTRPTGLALKRMIEACVQRAGAAIQSGRRPAEAIISTVDEAAATLARQGWKTGQRAAALLEDGSSVLTHCFPDRSYVYMLMEASRAGKRLNIICSETRPYMQGARLTSLCAQQAGFDATVITDGMGGFLMRRGDIGAFVTAADRVCMDGTVCNKIGTYQYALAASANDVPYFTLRQSGPDRESADENDIEVELRPGDALLYCGKERTAPPGVQGLYPAFDITPADLVTAIVTDRGVFEPSRINTYFDANSFVADAIL